MTQTILTTMCMMTYIEILLGSWGAFVSLRLL